MFSLWIAGTVIVIVVVTISSVVVLVVGIVIAVYIWKQRIIQKKRRGIRVFAICFELQIMCTKTWITTMQYQP